MRRVNARPRLDEAGVVLVAAGRQDMILSSRALVLARIFPAHARTDSQMSTLGISAPFANKFQQIS
jgi:hypothetical protein